jgi:hypothetical protein
MCRTSASQTCTPLAPHQALHATHAAPSPSRHTRHTRNRSAPWALSTQSPASPSKVASWAAASGSARWSETACSRTAPRTCCTTGCTHAGVCVFLGGEVWVCLAVLLSACLWLTRMRTPAVKRAHHHSCRPVHLPTCACVCVCARASLPPTHNSDYHVCHVCTTCGSILSPVAARPIIKKKEEDEWSQGTVRVARRGGGCRRCCWGARAVWRPGTRR